MISVLGKIKDVLGVIFVQKMFESWLKNNILFLIITYFNLKIVSEYDQEIPQSQTADYPVAPRGRAAQPSRDTRKTN